MSDPELAAFGHVLTHDAVTALGHPLGILALPLGLETHAQECDPERFGDGLDLLQMGINLIAGLVHVVQQCAGKFKLAAGFQCDGCAFVVQQGNRVALFIHRLPAELVGEALQHGAYASRALVGQGSQVIGGKAELFMFGTQFPLVLWFAA